ncbi:hypothetical protein ACPEIC_16595 [Stenotrophomonas sp. NPDC087984]
MTAEMVAPEWMHEQITAEQYDSWSEEQCAGIEVVDGMVVVSPSASKRHNRLARILANALEDAAGPDWNADTDFDARLQDAPLSLSSEAAFLGAEVRTWRMQAELSQRSWV